jgi:hypothetical protein
MIAAGSCESYRQDRVPWDPVERSLERISEASRHFIVTLKLPALRVATERMLRRYGTDP